MQLSVALSLILKYSSKNKEIVGNYLINIIIISIYNCLQLLIFSCSIGHLSLQYPNAIDTGLKDPLEWIVGHHGPFGSKFGFAHPLCSFPLNESIQGKMQACIFMGPSWFVKQSVKTCKDQMDMINFTQIIITYNIRTLKHTDHIRWIFTFSIR